MRFVRWVGIAIAVVGLGIGALFVLGRFSDGPPIEALPVPGGPLESGPLSSEPVRDWSFAAPVDQIELESDGRSRWVWVVVLDGQAYVPASLGFPPFKRWHRKALEAPDALVRIDGRRYPVRLEKVDDPALEARLGEAVRAKYVNLPPTDAGVWFFRLHSRAPGA